LGARLEEAGLPRPRQPFNLRGFSLSVRLPSEGLVQRRFQDEEEIIDEVTKELYVLPKKFTNRFKNIRAVVYKDILPSYALRIHTFYFLPTSKASEFLEVMETVKAQYAILQNDINAYLASRQDEYIKKVDTYTTKKNVTRFEKCPSLPEKVIIDIFPLNLGGEGQGQVVTDERVAIVLQKEYGRVVRESVINLEHRLSSVITRLNESIEAEINKKKVGVVKGQLEELIDIAKSANLDSIVGDPFKTTLLLADALENEDTDKLPTIVRSLAHHLGYDVDENNPHTALMDITLQMKKGLSPRVKALLEEVL